MKTPKSNEELLTLAYARCHYAADLLSVLWQNHESGSEPKRGELNKLVNLLREANAAAVELEERLSGQKPGEIGR